MDPSRAIFLMIGGGFAAVLALSLISAWGFDWSPPMSIQVLTAVLGIALGLVLAARIRSETNRDIPDLYVPIDMYQEDKVGSEAAFRMIPDDSTWPGGELAVKRMCRIGSGPLAHIDSREFGVIWEPGLPVRIHVRDQRGIVLEFDTIKAMLQHGWTLD